MRGYTEPVDVIAGPDDAPASFVWRGRRYHVREVIDGWREVMPWWRAAAGCADERGSREAMGDRPPRVLDRLVWRVEAAPGAMPGAGVFDLVSVGPRWFLERVAD